MMRLAAFTLFLHVMFWSALIIFGLALGLVVLLLFVRIRAINRRRRTNELVAFWRLVFTGKAANIPTNVRRGDVFTVLSLWNDFHRVRTQEGGISAQALTQIAVAHSFSDLAMELLRKGDAGDKLVALTTLGYLRASEATASAKALTGSPIGVLSIVAWRLLLLTDPSQMKVFAFELARHDDWRPRNIEELMRELGPQKISRAMAIAVEDTPDEQLVRVLRFFSLCEPPVVKPALRDLVTGRSNPDVIAAALRALAPIATPEDLPIVRGFLRHPASFIRIAAIGAIAPIAQLEDRPVLMELLSDHNSWVRYRAAQTLVQRFTDDGVEGDLRREVADQYARDALTQVLAERSVIELQEFVAQESGVKPKEILVERRPMDGLRVGV